MKVSSGVGRGWGEGVHVERAAKAQEVIAKATQLLPSSSSQKRHNGVGGAGKVRIGDWG